MPIHSKQYRARHVAMSVIAGCLMTACVSAQTAREVRGAAAVELLQNEPPAKIIIDPPLPEPLTRGRVVIQYRTEHLHIVPVFGASALAVSPRVGHIHVTVDDARWVWADASGEAVDLIGLPPGPHKIRLELETPNHQRLDQGAVTFTVPAAPSAAQATVPTPSHEKPAKIIVDAPMAEALSRGVLFIQYRTENVHLAPVFGASALAVPPRIGHIQVAVDDATWHWADASGNPVIINGLAPGPHTIHIELVDANHQPIDDEVVRVAVPKREQ
jgi:hypothetical protein